MKNFKFIYLLLLSSQISFAGTIEQALFRMEKSYNSENIMVIHTRTDDDCKFPEEKKNLIDFYWLINGKNKKPVHPMIRSGVEERIQVNGISADGDLFKVELTDLSEVKHDLVDPVLEIKSEVSEGECIVQAILTLGPSNKYRKIDLQKTYCEVTTNFLGIPNGCKFLELQGVDIDNGESVSVIYKRK